MSKSVTSLISFICQWVSTVQMRMFLWYQGIKNMGENDQQVASNILKMVHFMYANALVFKLWVLNVS